LIIQFRRNAGCMTYISESAGMSFLVT
jgi:hypothetical protein